MEQEVTSTFRVRMRHVRAARLCSEGARQWCQKNGVDWNDFLTNGISVERLREINDPITNRVIEAAEAEIEKE